jgi:hypothetical protein
MKPFSLALIFSGHMIDTPDRKEPRFPPALEIEAKRAIERRIANAKKATRGSVVGIASGARGGDILFLEACREAGLAVHVILPFPKDRFLDSSVRGVCSGNWEKRFYMLWDGLSPGSHEILTAPPGENAYDFCNRRMLAMAKEIGERYRLITLWDGKETGFKPGGTACLIALVRRCGGHISHIDTRALLRKALIQ